MNNTEFAKEYGFIIKPDKGKIELINLFPYQEDILNSFENNSRNMFIHSRQMGLSTMIAIHIARFLIYNKDKEKIICLKSNTQDCSQHILKRVRIILSNFYNGEFEYYCSVNNKDQINLFGNEVKIINNWSSTNSITDKIHTLIIDNFCFVKEINGLIDFFEKGTSCKKYILTSSYHYSYELEKLKSKFIETRINCRLHPHRDEKWFDEMALMLGSESYNKEIRLNGK